MSGRSVLLYTVISRDCSCLGHYIVKVLAKSEEEDYEYETI